jgi:hypothetical protein
MPSGPPGTCIFRSMNMRRASSGPLADAESLLGSIFFDLSASRHQVFRHQRSMTRARRASQCLWRPGSGWQSNGK